jgi:tRNA (cmo5U34)-methyltransferase
MQEETKMKERAREIDLAHKVGDMIAAQNAGWSFGGSTPQVFEAHVAKSVPLYNEGHDTVLQFSDYFLGSNSLCYEIGSSTGILLDKIVRHNARKTIRAVGVEVEPDMVSFAARKYTHPQISFVEADITEFHMEKSDMVFSYYTLQFIKPKFRLDVLKRIYDLLNWGGAFILFEKVRAPDARFQDIMTSLYIDYKIEQGYDP